MVFEELVHGTHFAEDFLRESITDTTEWKNVETNELEIFEKSICEIFSRFPVSSNPNESQTEDDLIWPILHLLGWNSHLRQQNLSVRGMENVPDGLLFADDVAKNKATQLKDEWKRYQFGAAIVESKRWMRPFDHRTGGKNYSLPAAAQMLRYLRRVDDLTEGKLRWGILTDGARWRLYFAGANSVSEQFFQINLAALIGCSGAGVKSIECSEIERKYWLKVFLLTFRKDAFLRCLIDSQTFHEKVIEESRFYVERVASSLSDLVFTRVFPRLACAIAEKSQNTSLEEIRNTTLTFLYRLLIILYAEDRNLLPVRDERYRDYSLRKTVRDDVWKRKESQDTFSESIGDYWSVIQNLCRAINDGDESIGLPPYNGGLFSPDLTPLFDEISLGDAVIADVVDALSFESISGTRRYVNYRDLGVQQLGSIYERLLEQEIVRDGNKISLRPNKFARKTSGSYYTPDKLVRIIVRETIDPLIEERKAAFETAVLKMRSSDEPYYTKNAILCALDPAEKLLELKICDLAMGSGHFLVHIVDYLADQVVTAMADVEEIFEDYTSPLAIEMDKVRRRIHRNASERGWIHDYEQLDDHRIIQRMILKRCIYGVDKNPMAVELAKVSLWLHTFTVGAPLNFLDHHLRCGDSLFGWWVEFGIQSIKKDYLLSAEQVSRAAESAKAMQRIEWLIDADISEVTDSSAIFNEVEEMTAPLNSFLSLAQAFDWMNIKDENGKAAIYAYFDGIYGNPIDIALKKYEFSEDTQFAERFVELLETARGLVAEERFLNWQLAFPGVWSNWESDELHGGFDAIVGNPPWDRLKLKQVDWFAARRREIALAPRAADRRRLISKLQQTDDPLAQKYRYASERSIAAARIARKSGDYPMLSSGDINLYSLFVERAMTLVNPDGIIGLLVPSGIASDKTAAPFFKSVTTDSRLKAFFDFENRNEFFPDVHASFKFSIFVASPSRKFKEAKCASYVHSTNELDDPERCFPLTAEQFARVNPNTGTAPIFRCRHDVDITMAIYNRLPVLVDRSTNTVTRAWQVKYSTMFHMTNNSNLFRTREELENQENAYQIEGKRFRSPSGDWVPLYEGKMVQAYDHRAASIKINPKNKHRPAQPVKTELVQQQDPDWSPSPLYWVLETNCQTTTDKNWVLGFKDVTAPTNARSVIAALMPKGGFSNTLPLLLLDSPDKNEWLLAANFNSIIFDFVARQKIHGQHLNLFVIEQLPVVPPDSYQFVQFGNKSAKDVVRDAVLELTYTSYDMAPFARDLNYLDEFGNVKPPFEWDTMRRLHLCAKLDAVFFQLYGIIDRDDISYIYSTFPILERNETSDFGRFVSRDLCLGYTNALTAGDPDVKVQLN